jgi:hypothetical protein
MRESAADEYVSPEHITEVMTHPSHLKGQEGLFYALTKNGIVVSVKQVCVSAKEHGAFTGSLEEFIASTNIFWREVVRLLRDGYIIDLAGLVELRLDVGGTFKHPDDPVDPKNNLLRLVIRRLRGAARAIMGIRVVNRGLAPSPAKIKRFFDARSNTENKLVTPFGAFTVEGPYIKIEGQTKPGDRIGISFFSPGNPGSPNINVGLTENLVINESNRIVAIAPDLLPDRDWYVRIRTRYSGGGTPLKETRELTSEFPLRMAVPDPEGTSPGPTGASLDSGAL